MDVTLRQLIDAKESGVCSQYEERFLVIFVFECDRSIALIMMVMDHMTISEEPIQLCGN